MAPTVDLSCPQCGRSCAGEALVCALCGHLLRARVQVPLKPAAVRPTLGSERDTRFAALRTLIPEAPTHAVVESSPPRRAPDRPGRERTDEEERDARRAGLEPWIYLAIGLATAPVFALTPILGYMGWFLASLVHEMGHAALAWSCGMPAVPAISLDGHAAAVHSEQSFFLLAVVFALLVAGVWRIFEGRVRWIVLALVAVIHPAIALTGAKDLLHLLAGHGAELAFASMCLWKALDGGFTDSKLERGLYGTVGWYLLGKNMILCWGLMRSAEARAEYDENGSFGLTNDYIRVAQDVLSCPLERVALTMFIASLLVLPAAFCLWRLSQAVRRR